MSPPPRAVRTGLEVFLDGRAGSLSGARVGLLANPASIDRSYVHAARRLREAGLHLTALFGAEHGFALGEQDMVAVEGERDGSTGLQVFSLYGDSLESLSPSPAMLGAIDVLVADLQDVGSRYYTFAATVALALEALAPAGRKLLVLDRPNPLGGQEVEGPGIDPGLRSFVGHIRVPVRHGLTMGELVRLHADELGLQEALEVVPMDGWRRSMSWSETGAPWIPPSPNMATLETAFVYPGACLIEATNLSEGRGTTHPFEWIGAPFLDGARLASRLGAMSLPGVAFRPHAFVPAFHKWAGQVCAGVAVHVIDRDRFRPFRTGLALLLAARALAPGKFAWRREPYEFVSDRPAIDLLTGSPRFRAAIEAGATLDEACAGLEREESAWRAAQSGHFLYD